MQGAAIAISVSRAMPQYTAGVSSVNAVILATGTFAMFSIAALALSIPAMRVCRVQPLAALRHE